MQQWEITWVKLLRTRGDPDSPYQSQHLRILLKVFPATSQLHTWALLTAPVYYFIFVRCYLWSFVSLVSGWNVEQFCFWILFKYVTKAFCETQWPRPPLFSPSWLIQWSMGEGFYITLFSPIDVTAFHRMKYGGRGCYITLFSPSDVTAFHRIE